MKDDQKTSACCAQHTEQHEYHEQKQESVCASACEATIEVTASTKSDIPEGWLVSDWSIPELDCPTEEGMINKKLADKANIRLISCNTMKNRARIAYVSGQEGSIETAIRELGFTPQKIEAGSSTTPTEQSKIPTKKRWRVLGVAGVLAFGAELLHAVSAPEAIVLFSAVVSILLCGLSTFKSGLLAIKNKNLNINALMSVAVIGALLIQQWPEAAMVMFLFTIAEMLEAYSLVRAKKAIQGLMALTPEVVTILDDRQQWQTVPVADAPLGATARVKPGERVALDGEVTAGFSTVNQAPITGESMPIEKQPGDSVFAGTINESGSFEYRITAAAKDTTLARIIEAVENAQSTRAPIQSFIDKFAAYYIPVIFALALIVAFGIPLFVGNWYAWIYKALVLLVIACPCALVISTPVTIVSGLSLAAKKGILIKGGVYLELGRKLKWLAVDKTGTLTHGRPVQTDFIDFSENITQTRMLAVSLAARSDHPVSVAISRAAEELNLPEQEVIQFTALPGFGTQGEIDGKIYYLVNQRFVMEKEIHYPEVVQQQVEALQGAGKTVVLFCEQTQVLGAFAVADTVKEDVKETIAQLHKIGVKTLMITGDNQQVADVVAREVGIDEVYAQQLPEDKLNVIKRKHEQSGVVAMAGDGINDAPALAQADIGIAMGQLGTDTAVETADVVLMDDKLSKIVTYIKISTKTYQILIQNISFALGVKIVFVVLALFGLSTMWMAIFADVGATLLVVFNGLRLLLQDKSDKI